MAKERPRILLITSDQQHWNTPGIANPEAKPPRLDRLAAEGTVFTHPYCPNPTCTPPRTMVGVHQSPVWLGAKESARDHVIAEHDRDYSELFDLQSDPNEISNLWSVPRHAALKSELIMKLLFAEMDKEPLRTPRTAPA